MFEQAIKWGEPLNISTKSGNAVLISEDEYNSLLETVYISANPVLKEKIIEGLNTPLEDCIPEDDIKW